MRKVRRASYSVSNQPGLNTASHRPAAAAAWEEKLHICRNNVWNNSEVEICPTWKRDTDGVGNSGVRRSSYCFVLSCLGNSLGTTKTIYTLHYILLKCQHSPKDIMCYYFMFLRFSICIICVLTTLLKTYLNYC